MGCTERIRSDPGMPLAGTVREEGGPGGEIRSYGQPVDSRELETGAERGYKPRHDVHHELARIREGLAPSAVGREGGGAPSLLPDEEHQAYEIGWAASFLPSWAYSGAWVCS